MTEIYQRLGQPIPEFDHAGLAAGSAIKADHILELRSALAAIENDTLVAAPSLPIAGVAYVEGRGDVTGAEKRWLGARWQPLRIEGIALTAGPALDAPLAGVFLDYMCHIEDVGDTGWVTNGVLCGSRGSSRRLEGFAIRIWGPEGSQYTVQYWCEIEGIGVVGPKSDGAFCGTRGQARRVNALYVQVLKLPTPQCDFGVSPILGNAISSSGGTLRLNVIAQPTGCSGPWWSAHHISPFLQLDRTMGYESDTITVTVAPSDVPRTGTITFSSFGNSDFDPGPVVTIEQSGPIGPPCTINLNPKRQAVAGGGGMASVDLWLTPDNCWPQSWKAHTASSFLHIFPSSGIGNQAGVNITVDAAAAARSGFVVFNTDPAATFQDPTTVDITQSAPTPGQSGPRPIGDPRQYVPGNGRGSIHCGYAVYPKTSGPWGAMPFLWLDVRLGYNRFAGTPEVQIRNLYNKRIYFDYRLYDYSADLRKAPSGRFFNGLVPSGQSEWVGLATDIKENGHFCVLIDNIRFVTDSGPYY